MKDVFFGAVVVFFVAGMAVPYLGVGRSAQRRVYWSCALLAGGSAFLMFSPDWRKGLAVAGFAFAVMVIAAYTTTPYIKIGSRIFALSLADSRPDDPEAATRSGGDADPTPDSYSGMLSAAKMWWMLVIIAVIAGGNVYYAAVGREKGLVPLISAGFVALLAIGIGYADGSWDYPIARRQYLQFATASLVTAGGVAVLYVAAYYAARAHPLRREQSLEYRAHPRHQKRRSLDQ